jgi:hypothetical protein
MLGAGQGPARGARGSLHLRGQIRLGKKYSIDVRDAHGLPHCFGYISMATLAHTIVILYGKIERFVRFLRGGDMRAGSSLLVVVRCSKLQPAISCRR